MLKYLNRSSVIQCAHGGQIQLLPTPSRSFTIEGSPIVTDGDLLRATIVGCTQVQPGMKPCTRVTQILLGRAREIEVDGEIPLLEHLQALTDGAPPGLVFQVANPTSNAQIGRAMLDSPQVKALIDARAAALPFCQVCDTAPDQQSPSYTGARQLGAHPN